MPALVTISELHELLTTERAMVGAIRVPDGSEAAYCMGYADALDYVLDVIAHRTDAVSRDELRAGMRGEQIANSLLAR